MTKLHTKTSPQSTIALVIRASKHWFWGDADIQSTTPSSRTPCWLLLDVEASFMLAREHWNKGEDGLYNPHISLILIEVHLWCTLFCLQNGCWDLCYAASFHCSVPCSSPWSPLFPLKSPMALPCWIPLTLCFVFFFWSILDSVTSYILYFYQLNFCFIFTLKTYFDTISILNCRESIEIYLTTIISPSCQTLKSYETNIISSFRKFMGSHQNQTSN